MAERLPLRCDAGRAMATRRVAAIRIEEPRCRGRCANAGRSVSERAGVCCCKRALTALSKGRDRPGRWCQNVAAAALQSFSYLPSTCWGSAACWASELADCAWEALCHVERWVWAAGMALRRHAVCSTGMAGGGPGPSPHDRCAFQRMLARLGRGTPVCAFFFTYEFISSVTNCAFEETGNVALLRPSAAILAARRSVRCPTSNVTAATPLLLFVLLLVYGMSMIDRQIMVF